MRRRVLLTTLALLLSAGAIFYVYGRSVWVPMYLRVFGERSVVEALKSFGPSPRLHLLEYCRGAGVSYPPSRLALLVFKRERRVAMWAKNSGGDRWHFLHAYPVLAASGTAGPKLREGDYQVPEGLYRIEWLNPNSSYHVSMKVSYPNAFDRQMAKQDGRTRLGGDIFIHGKALSIGCVAVGDRAIEELFTLVADIGPERVQVVIAPNDLRVAGAVMREGSPRWLGKLYASIAAALTNFPVALEADASMDVRDMEKSKVRRVK
jgi:hypothetical protein